MPLKEGLDGRVVTKFTTKINACVFATRREWGDFGKHIAQPNDGRFLESRGMSPDVVVFVVDGDQECGFSV